MAVGQSDFAFFEFSEIELNSIVFGQTQVQGACIDKGQGCNRL